MLCSKISLALRGAFLGLACVLTAGLSAQLPTPVFTSEATVHDPSVIRVGERYYVFGSHLGAAWTSDLMNWTQISTNAAAGNTLIPNVAVEMQEALSWASTNTFWAPDVIQLGDGRFYMYYCNSIGNAPRGVTGLAVADAVGGPYRNVGVLLKSGMWGQASPDGTIYDATVHPHTVDPAVFFDATGRLWMMYGSYSGGIFIMELNPETGLLLGGQGYGKHLLGGNHARIEGAYVLYHPETEYYYMFVSFGGLDAVGAYNVRVSRSRQPDGPYVDAAGRDMATVKGAPGTLFDDASIAPHGVKLMGNARFLAVAGEPRTTSRGYVSPGHNSAYYDAETGKAYIFFHTRFVGTGEVHNVRIHQLFFNEDEWPVVAPRRYAGETTARYQSELLRGSFKVIEHGKDISAVTKNSVVVELRADGSVSGARTGSWELLDGTDIRLTLGSKSYRGVVSHHWDDDQQVWVMGFSGLSGEGEAVWGSKVATSLSFIQQWRMRHFGVSGDSGDAANAGDPDRDGRSNLLEYALGSDPKGADAAGLSLFRVLGGGLVASFSRVFAPELSYRVEGSDSPSQGDWAEAVWSGRGDGVSEENIALDPEVELEGAERRYWRLRVEP